MGDNNHDNIASENGGCIATPAGDRDRLEPPHRNSVTRKAGTRFAHRVVLTQRHHERGTPDAMSRQTLEVTFFDSRLKGRYQDLRSRVLRDSSITWQSVASTPGPPVEKRGGQPRSGVDVKLLLGVSKDPNESRFRNSVLFRFS